MAVCSEEKLLAVSNFGSIAGIDEKDGWTRVTPDAHGDWVKKRDNSFNRYAPSGIKDKTDTSMRLFGLFSLGVVTNRDAWACSPSHAALAQQMQRMVTSYNAELKRLNSAHGGLDRRARSEIVDDFIDTDPKKIAWTRSLKNELAKGTRLAFQKERIVPSLYRPFSRHWLYFDRKLNEMVYQIPRLFPQPSSKNLVIGVSASESRSGYSVLMTDVVPSLHSADMVGSQFFPLYVYDSDSGVPSDTQQPTSVRRKQAAAAPSPKRRDGITNEGLSHFQRSYPGEKISKEDVFYYVYGILHAADYRERYADNLGKELPRIPRAKTAAAFWDFSNAGRALGDLHVGYERAAEYPGVKVEGPTKPSAAQYRVEKMRFGKGKDKTVILYNPSFTLRDIPIEAYEYMVNGKSAIEWVMDRQTVTTDTTSGIVRDANAGALETEKNPRHPLSLLLRIITVSLETVKLVRGLPPLEVMD